MINSIDLSGLLGQYFQDIKPVSDSVLRCQRFYEGKPYQIVFVDYSDQFLSYDLENYLKQHLSADYFRSVGPLQWNFYLIFLTVNAVPESDRRRIEGNPDYARKLIISFDELPAWLNRSYLGKRSSQANARPGLADIWKGKLKETRLDCIFSEQIKVNEGVDRIISGNNFVEKGTRKSVRQFADHDVNLGELRHFEPTGFREYPKFNQPFAFEKVNLIDGANGFGKTSLLESVEFFVTGGNARVDEPFGTFKLSASYEMDVVPRVYKKDPALLRERDRVWYNGMGRQRGSDLTAHFNQFNFYNTDAAFRLTVNKNEREIEEAFRDIALGDEVNFLKRQFTAYESRFQSEIKARAKLIGEYNSDIYAQRILISDLRRSVDGSNNLITALFEKINKLRLSLNTESADLVSLDRLKFSISLLLSELDVALDKLNWLDNLSLQSMEAELALLVQLIESTNEFATSHEEAVRNLQKIDEKQKFNDNAKILLTELAVYYRPENVGLQGMSSGLIELRTRVNLLREVQEAYTKLEIGLVSFPDLPLTEAQSGQAIRHREKEEAIKRMEEEINAERQTLSALNAVIASLKSEGKRFISLDPNGTICPLCQSELHYSQTRNNALLRTLEISADRDKFSSLLYIKGSLEKERDEADAQFKIITAMIHILSLLPQIGTENITLRGAQQMIDDLLKSLLKDAADLAETEASYENMASRGLSETRFSELCGIFAIYYPTSVQSAETIEAKLKGLVDVIAQTAAEKETLEIQEKKRERELLDRLLLYDSNFTLDQTDLIGDRELLIRHHLKELSNLVSKDFDRNQELRKLQIELQVLMQQLDEVRADMDSKQKENKLVAKANNIIDEKTALLDIVSAETERLQKSADDLSKILMEYSENDFLQEFLDMNRTEIREIFLAIHSPREFKDINIIDGRVILDKVNGDTADLLHVSTGQRSALALSLFLTLNSKLKNGPAMIIFDDPVAFTDDLNILSFLDYLREIVFDQHNQRQLFFATANENLSFLFQKKFEVMGNRFNHITLER